MTIQSRTLGHTVVGSQLVDPLKGFVETLWIERFGSALEQVAASARPWNFPQPVMQTPLPIEVYRAASDRAYRTLAMRARVDVQAAAEFAKSYLRVDDEPVEAMSILREHPVVKLAPEVPDGNKTIRFWLANRGLGTELKTFVLNLAKLSFRDGGKDAASRLHRYLTAGADGALPAHEIIVIHGLTVKAPFHLGRRAYLASYKSVRAEFDLPEEPDIWLEDHATDPAVLVRDIQCGPGLVPEGYGVGPPDSRITYLFPADYGCDLDAWFGDSRLLVDLFSISIRAPLLTRTRFVRVPRWIGEIDPNFALGSMESGGWRSDVSPTAQDDLQLCQVDAFVDLAHGWYTYPDTTPAMASGVRRLAGALSRPGGRFGHEDRILDVAIALEVLYGGKTGHRLARRAAALLGTTASEQMHTYDQARSFYRTRSTIVHTGSNQPPSIDHLDHHLQAGHDLGCRTLTALLNLHTTPDWAEIQKNIVRDAAIYIEGQSPRRNTRCGTSSTSRFVQGSG